ncbi:MAG: DUF2934 domain-containing protein [Sulfuritalea sp.]|nr:DUF2934 domain-containing protein [Sulfuritalea sp.]
MPTTPKASKSESKVAEVTGKRAKAPAAKAPAGKTPATQKAPTRTASVRPGKAANPFPELTLDQRRYYVEVAAYYIAERRGFRGGSEMDDWVRAEEEIDRLLREGILRP